MKIGILTLPFNNNYGGYLQAYALLTVLKQKGHNVEIIYRRPNRRPLKVRFLYPFKVIVKTLLKIPHGPLIMNQESDLRSSGSQMMPFVDKYISPKTPPYYTTSKMEKECKGRYDIVIVGSDQVWRPKYVPCIKDFFFDFIKEKHVKKVAYAVSFGTATPEYKKTEINHCRELISEFEMVSVREKSALDVIRTFKWKTKTPPQLVLDPTFLLSKSCYERIISNKIRSNPLNRIFCYILDSCNVVDEIIKQVEIKLQLSSYHLFNKKIKNFQKPSIETWLNNIRNSQFVITDSFHGMVFCIIFNRSFIIFVNEDRGTERFTSLLSLLELENRICKNIQDIDNILSESIDWKNVNSKLSLFRDLSFKFINESLNY